MAIFYMTRQLLLPLIAGMLLITGMFFLMGCDKYGNAPMTQDMYEYLNEMRGKQSKETDEKLTEIARQYIPLGTPIKEVLKFFTANHFECGGPYTKKLLQGVMQNMGVDLRILEANTCLSVLFLLLRFIQKKEKW